MPTPDVDVARILEALDRHDVEYIVIGGFAAELHDVAIPATADIDITPSASDENLEKLASVLSDLNARLRVPDNPNGFPVPGGITADLLGTMQVVTLITDVGPLDISMTPSGTDGFSDLKNGLEHLPYRDREVPVAALEDVIRSKEAAGREKDLLVLPALRAHLRATQRRRGRPRTL